MKLLRLELQNWCQHSELAIDFPSDPIIHLSGPNNVGKSNLIRAIGRVLAQGRSDFGDTSDIQYGAKQATIRLSAQTAEGTRFIISRVIKDRPNRTSLEFDGQALTNTDDIQNQLQAWFGRQETLLQLFIAPQGKIASLLKERGKERLTKFIEICGFKGFLQKQASLNKFIKSYPTLFDSSLVLQDVQGKIRQAEEQAAEKKAQIAQLQDKTALQHEMDRLQSSKTLCENHRRAVEDKQSRLKTAETTISRPLPDLQKLQEKLTHRGQHIQRLRLCVRHQQAHKERSSLQAAQQELGKTQEDRTDFTRLIQESSVELQGALEQRNKIDVAEQALAQSQTELSRLDRIIQEQQQLVHALTYSTAWHAQPMEVLTQIQALAFQQQAKQPAVETLRVKIAKFDAIPQPSEDVLKACQASEDQLQDLVHLQKHARQVEDSCPLCRQAWTKEAITHRIQAIEQQAKEVRSALQTAPKAWKVYREWLSAQSELPKLKESLETEKSAVAELNRRLSEKLQAASLPERDLPWIGEIIANYHRVKDALSPPTKDADALRMKVAAENELSAKRREEAAQLIERIATSNQKMQEILKRQSAAQEQHKQRARLQKQIEMVQQGLRELEQGLGEPPAEFSADENYVVALATAEQEMTKAQEQFRKASWEWTSRFEQMKGIEALKVEIASLTSEIATLAWSDEKEARLSEVRKHLETHHQLAAEANLIHQQIESLQRQLVSLQVDQRKFEEQCRNVADMQAASDFLAYDNGPQKFLQGFLQEAINQTNILLSEMGLPVTLHMGPDLEILVSDRNSQQSSALSLGGGYSNLIGIAFRIALQKMILPRVHAIILDEPSTHIDEENMELLVPFFERLKDNLHSYGIDQCLIIDHHPAWKNSSMGLIRVGDQK